MNLQKRKEEVQEHAKEACPMCGRRFPERELIWSGRARAWLCPDCLAEEEACGCEE